MSGFSDWESELYHHGILGMKWGIRRYQNPDGTLTEAGKRRLRAEDMSDKDLEARIKRLKMENEYRQLNKGRVSRAVDYIRAFNKERADNREKKSRLLTAKAAMRAKNPFFVLANKLGDKIGDGAGDLVKKQMDKIGDDLAAILPSTDNVKAAKKWLWEKGKEKVPEAARKAKKATKDIYDQLGDDVIERNRRKNSSAWNW